MSDKNIDKDIVEDENFSFDNEDVKEIIEENMELEKEILIKDKMIDLMAERIEQDNEIEFYCNGDFSCSFIDGICKESDEYKENYHMSCTECIKEHFRNEVLKDE